MVDAGINAARYFGPAVWALQDLERFVSQLPPSQRASAEWMVAEVRRRIAPLLVEPIDDDRIDAIAVAVAPVSVRLFQLFRERRSAFLVFGREQRSAQQRLLAQFASDAFELDAADMIVRVLDAICAFSSREGASVSPAEIEDAMSFDLREVRWDPAFSLIRLEVLWLALTQALEVPDIERVRELLEFALIDACRAADLLRDIGVTIDRGSDEPEARLARLDRCVAAVRRELTSEDLESLTSMRVENVR